MVPWNLHGRGTPFALETFCLVGLVGHAHVRQSLHVPTFSM